MNPSLYFIFLVLIIVFVSQRNNMRALLIRRKFMKKRTKGGTIAMVELAKKFVGKDCIISTFTNSGFVGIITEVSESAIMIQNGNDVIAVNLEFVVSIKEHPRNKKGKKKAIVV